MSAILDIMKAGNGYRGMAIDLELQKYLDLFPALHRQASLQASNQVHSGCIRDVAALLMLVQNSWHLETLNMCIMVFIQARKMICTN